MMGALRATASAWALLTIIPLPGAVAARLRSEDWARGAGAFPLIGLLIGTVTAAIAYLATRSVGPFAGAVVAVLTGTILTAGLHLDGLADCADALGARGAGEAQRRRRLEILRDSATGSYGTLALIGAVVLPAATLASLALAGAAALVTALLLAAPLARLAGVVHAALLPPARTGGLGASFTVSRPALLAATAVAALIVAAISAAWLADRRSAGAAAAPLLALVGATTATALTTPLSAAKLGGRTGDTIGATIALAEVLALLGFLAGT